MTKESGMLKKDLNFIYISDLLQDCIYAKDKMNLKYINILISNDDPSHDSENTITILLRNNEKINTDQKKEYDLNVESAEYTIQTQYNEFNINTMSDGSWGKIFELFSNGKLCGIDICLEQPSEVYSIDEFMNIVENLFGLNNVKYKPFVM